MLRRVRKRDKDRVLDGLKGAISQDAGIRAADYGDIITKLKSRVFLMHNVHGDGPVVFNTRWAISYLRGPLTKPQVRELMRGRAPSGGTVQTPLRRQVPTQPAAGGLSPDPPSTDPSIPVVFIPVTRTESWARDQLDATHGVQAHGGATRLVYNPVVLCTCSVGFTDKKRMGRVNEELTVILPPPDGSGIISWDRAQLPAIDPGHLARDVDYRSAGALFAPVPAGANSPRELSAIKKEVISWLYQTRRMALHLHRGLKLYQEADEDARDFLARVRHAAKERRDAQIAALEHKYARKLDTLAEEREKLELKLESDKADHDARKREEMAGVGESVLSLFMGRRRTSSISTMTRKRRLTDKAKHEIAETTEGIERVSRQAAELEAELKSAADEISATWDKAVDDVEEVSVSPKKSDIAVRLVALAWAPSWEIAEGGHHGTSVAAYE